MISEIRKHEELIRKKSGLSKPESEILFSLIINNIQIVEKEKYADKLTEADDLIGKVDKGDVPFLALALSGPNDGIWTENVKDFKSQNKVRIWTTRELVKEFE